MAKILLTGHRGNICSRLNQRLLQDGHEVFGVDLKDGVDCADVTNLDSFKDVEVVFHLAAHIQYPKKNTMDACDGIAEFIRGRKHNIKVIYSSSAAIYSPYTMYAVHKLYGEALFSEKVFKSKLAILRLFNVYGGSGIGLIDKIDKREHINVYGNGEQRRDYVHINDVVDAFVSTLDHDYSGVADVGTGSSYSVNKVLEMADYSDFEHTKNYGGVMDSKANLNPLFPWYPKYDLQTYLAKAR